MTSKQGNAKGRKAHGAFFKMPSSVINSKNYQGLSGNAAKLLTQICDQFKGGNNGDLQASFNIFKARGWKSPVTLQKCIDELINSGLLYKTRQGFFPKTCSLFAVTWLRIDEKPSYKYDPTARELVGKTLGINHLENNNPSCTETVSI
ncbi:hypothetical protein J3998_03715 [Thiomicrorhabdus sp. 6S2-11]|uniref:Uncharacterized protein n=1 Tax=Thiomicrorhabdus marina TaxID=2818442 RepID=A0ABS3Q2X2_9GAMM|nr:hypothetical protein [Thiomicrorhabdus marina]MBO1926675.1 hypothetical protein [Thiomicrorhabdus marina]